LTRRKALTGSPIHGNVDFVTLLVNKIKIDISMAIENAIMDDALIFRIWPSVRDPDGAFDHRRRCGRRWRSGWCGRSGRASFLFRLIAANVSSDCG
jgi:hypothetical protein